MISVYEVILRLVLSSVLAGIIGLERESIKRPAGFRTHILVCLGSTLVMLVGLYTFHTYKAETNLDITRLGAQVISGIGFLGAGTILKEGSTVKGLTTAASLWAVACIGLAVGIGFYSGAISTTVLVFIILISFGRVERYVSYRKQQRKVSAIICNKPGQIGKIGKALGDSQISILNIEMETIDDDYVNIHLLLSSPNQMKDKDIFDLLMNVEGIYEVKQQ